MSRCLVFGDTGFIGSALCEGLLNAGEDVLGVSRSNVKTNHPHEVLDLVKDPIEKIQALVDNFQPDKIYHFAADPLVRNYDYKTSESNILATHKLLDCCPKSCMFVFASSATVYGKHSSHRYVWSNTKPISVYAHTKLFCENLIKMYSNTYRKIDQFVILRFCAHVGPNATHGLLYDIANKLKSDNPKLELLGVKPGPKKPYISIENSVKAIIEASHSIQLSWSTYNVSVGKYFNVSPNDNLSVEQIAKIVMQEVGIHKPIKFLGKQSNWPGDNNFVKLWPTFDWIPTSEETIREHARAIR